VISGLVTALLVRGHVLLEGVPGVAKTLLVTTLARSLDLDAARVQFTPDLMPADVTGQTILDRGGDGFRFREGPVFTNLLLADEINRTPPRTQAALLEAMQERQVSVDGHAAAPARAVPGRRDAEPRRARGHLPPARGPARPVPVQAAGALPEPRAGAGDRGRHATGTDAGDVHTARSRRWPGRRSWTRRGQRSAR
jgi:MoxR-like ATPase